MLGVQRPSLSKVLKELERDGLIVLSAIGKGGCAGVARAGSVRLLAFMRTSGWPRMFAGVSRSGSSPRAAAGLEGAPSWSGDFRARRNQ
jgi:hypothetical protein